MTLAVPAARTNETFVHPTAIVSPKANLGAGVKIGAYSMVGEDVSLGDGVELVSHVVVAGRTEIGAETQIFPFASIGHVPQDRKYHGEPSRLVIGERCVIRENATVNPGTEGGGMETRIGDDCLLMASTHVAHDAKLDFFSKQVRTSRNVSGGWWATWLMGGLNYQIEHHLFPSMPRPNLRHAQGLVRTYCDRHGIAYHETGLFNSYAQVLRYLHAVGGPLRPELEY